MVAILTTWRQGRKEKPEAPPLEGNTWLQGLIDLCHLSSNNPGSAYLLYLIIRMTLMTSLLVLLHPGFITLGGTGGAYLAVTIKTRVCSLLCLLKPACWVQPRHQHCLELTSLTSKQAYLHTKIVSLIHSLFHHFTHEHVVEHFVNVNELSWFHVLVLGNQAVLVKVTRNVRDFCWRLM